MLGNTKKYFVGPEDKYGCRQGSMCGAQVSMELIVWMQVSGESSGFLDAKTRY